MSPRKDRASGQSPANRSPRSGGARGSADPEREGYTSRSDASLVGSEERRYTCPACGSDNLALTHKVGQYGGWTVLIHCWGCGGGLDDVSAASGIPRRVLLKWPPPKELGPQVPRGHAAGVAGQINPARVEGWQSALWSKPHALALEYLRDTRGLLDETITEYRLGYDSDADAIVFPVYDAGEPVRIKLRYLDQTADPKTWNSPGPSCLYPDLPESHGVLLVGGEMDALIGRQMGLPTVTPTCGPHTPPHIARQFTGKRVFIMFDVGEHEVACMAEVTLCGVAAEVHIVDLSRIVSKRNGDLNDFYIEGGTRKQIVELIKRETRAA